MAPPLIVRAVLDAAGYLKVSESVVSSNTAMADSALGMGADFTKSAEAQVAAGAKVIASQRAQLTQLKAIQAEAVAGSDRRIAADVAVAKAQNALSRSTGGVVLSTRAVSTEAKTAERDVGKLTRGALAGSGVFSALGRSLAFASSGFIAVAGGATLIAASIRQAEGLAAAQRQVDRQLQTSGKSWTQYGSRIDSVLLKEGHLAGFTRAQLLQAFGYLLRVGGNVQRSLNLTGLAADVARGRSISLQAASIALSKALGGSATALRRLGIIVPNNVTKMQALEYVQKKFAGQAEAGTTGSQRLSASLADAGATIGTVLLPTFDRLASSFSNWLQRMNSSGKLTRDVAFVTSKLGVVFHVLEAAISAVDRVTGSFGHTLVLIGEIWAGIKIAGWIRTLGTLSAAWTGVAASATAAADAEGAAAGGSLLGPAARGGVLGREAGTVALLGGGSTRRIVSARDITFTQKAGELTAVEEGAAAKFPVAKGAFTAMATTLEGFAPIAAALVSLQIIESKTYKDLRQKAIDAAGGSHSFLGGAVFDLTRNITELPGQAIGSFHDTVKAWKGFLGLLHDQAVNVTAQIEQERKALGLTRLDRLFSTTPQPVGPFGGAQPHPQISKQFTLPYRFQLKQAEDALTASLADDVKTAKAIVAYTKRLIDEGNYHGQALLQLLQAESSAQATINQAAASAAAKRKAAAAAALQAASTYNVPGTLQLAQAKAEAYGKSETTVLKKIIAAAEKAIRSGGKNWQGLVAAYQTIANARAQLEQDAQAALIPLKLQLQLAKAQALGTDQTPILKKMKAALERALKAARGNIQKQIDIWNQIAAINQQLGQNITNSYGDYKKASLKWETQGLGLTPDQRRKLEARLSQIGPGGTHPMSGTGAAGFIIDPETGRPIDRHHRRRQGSQYSGSGGSRTPTVNVNLDLQLNVDGRQLEVAVTKRQQKSNTRRPAQRRGPYAATR